MSSTASTTTSAESKALVGIITTFVGHGDRLALSPLGRRLHVLNLSKSKSQLQAYILFCSCVQEMKFVHECEYEYEQYNVPRKSRSLCVYRYG